MLGVVLQRAQIICTLIIIPVSLLFHYIEPILLKLGQHPDIVAITSEYLHILIPSLFLTMINETNRKYLLAQRVVTPGMISSICTTALSPVFNWLYIYRYGGRRGQMRVVGGGGIDWEYAQGGG